MRIPCTFLVCVLALPALAAAEECDKNSYGTGVRLADSTPVSELLETPDPWVGRVVRVEGRVADVCEMAGCWLEIQAAEGERVVKVKVEDGVIVFPLSARGKQAIAEGTFERLELDRDKYLAIAKHAAAEKGETFDPASVGDGPYRIYQIAGTGAEICR